MPTAEVIILIESENTQDAESKFRNVVLPVLCRTTQLIIRYRLGELLEFDREHST